MADFLWTEAVTACGHLDGLPNGSVIHSHGRRYFLSDGVEGRILTDEEGDWILAKDFDKRFTVLSSPELCKGKAPGRHGFDELMVVKPRPGFRAKFRGSHPAVYWCPDQCVKVVVVASRLSVNNAWRLRDEQGNIDDLVYCHPNSVVLVKTLVDEKMRANFSRGSRR